MNLRGKANLVDPDAIARQLDPEDPSRAALAAGRETILRCRRFVEQKLDFVLETTLAGNSALAVLRSAKSAGYRVEVVYVSLDSADLQKERVRLRVLRGGHHVPDDDVTRRYERSHLNLPAAAALADETIIFDNSAAVAYKCALLAGTQIVWRAKSLPAWAEKILLDLR